MLNFDSLLNEAERLIFMEKNIYVIHHTDNDGFCAAAVIADMHGIDRIKFCPYAYRETKNFKEFVDEALENASRIYVVDVAIEDPENYPYMDKISRSPKTVWIDHHETSLRSEDTYPHLRDIPGIRRTDRSAAWLCWEYRESTGYSGPMPEVVKLVDDHDRFIHNMEDSLAFANGTFMRCNSTDPNWEMWISLIYEDTYLMEDILHDGRVICQYNEMIYAKSRRGAGICILEDRREGETKKYLGVCINDNVNSLVFGDQLIGPKAKVFGVTYYFNHYSNKWMYSVYSSNPSFNCAEVAEFFGGGGHKGAAGFSSDELLIHNGTIIIE